MYRDEYSSECIYSIAEAAALLCVSIEDLYGLIKAKKLGSIWTTNGFVVSNSHIGSYLIDSGFETKRISRNKVRYEKKFENRGRKRK